MLSRPSIRFAQIPFTAARTGLLAAVAVSSLAALAVTLPSAASQEGDSDVPVASSSSASVDRGRYLANEVSMCVQCHSPRDRQGELLRDSHFDGAPLPVKSPFKGVPRWAFTAPNLKNAPGYTEEEFIKFLSTGMRPNGTEARGPMPPFRMNRSDAKAVYDYLMSL